MSDHPKPTPPGSQHMGAVKKAASGAVNTGSKK